MARQGVEVEEQQNGESAVDVEPVRLEDDRCANCGNTEFLAHRMVVPKEIGGNDVPTNYILLCKACEFAASLCTRSDPCRAVNVYLSRELFESVRSTIAVRNGHASISSLARFLVASYMKDQDYYEDVSLYQDEGTDVRANMWLDGDIYDDFKQKVYQQGMTVTQVLKGLLRMYVEATVPATSEQKETVE